MTSKFTAKFRYSPAKYTVQVYRDGNPVAGSSGNTSSVRAIKRLAKRRLRIYRTLDGIETDIEQGSWSHKRVLPWACLALTIAGSALGTAPLLLLLGVLGWR